MERSITFYEELFGESCHLRFEYANMGLELAQIGTVLLIAGSEIALLPFKATKVTFLVDTVFDGRDALLRQGAIILDGPQQVPTGWNMRVKHPDGTLAEYVQLVNEEEPLSP
jgi:hypothetical protein